MKYTKGYKYQLSEGQKIVWQTDFRPLEDIVTKHVVLQTNGILSILEGFAWDGVSGPVVDRDSNNLGGAVHDALYYLMRHGYLDCAEWKLADLEFAKALKQCGAWDITISIDMLGLKAARGKHANPKSKKAIHEINAGDGTWLISLEDDL